MAARPVSPPLAPRSRQIVTRRRLLAATGRLLGAAGVARLTLAGLALSGCTLPVPAPVVPTPTVGPAVDASDVLVGVVLSLTGRFSREGALMKAGYETWADAVRRDGGIAVGSRRRSVRLIVVDDESEPLTAVRQIERLLDGQGVRLVLGPFSSQITTAVAAATEKVGAVLVAPDASAPALFRRGLTGLFAIQATDDRLFWGLAELAAGGQPPAQPAGLLVADEPSLVAAASGFRERADALRLRPVQVEMMALGSRNITAAVERLAELMPRLVVLAAEPGQPERFGPTVRELLPNTPMRAFLPLPEPADASGRRPGLFDGALTVETWSPALRASGPLLGSAREFAGRFHQLHGYAPDARCAAAAAAGLALQLAVERAEAGDPAVVRQALAGLSVSTFWGPLAWDSAGRNRVAIPPVLQQQGDEVVPVYPLNLAGDTVLYPLRSWPAG